MKWSKMTLNAGGRIGLRAGSNQRLALDLEELGATELPLELSAAGDVNHKTSFNFKTHL